MKILGALVFAICLVTMAFSAPKLAGCCRSLCHIDAATGIRVCVCENPENALTWQCSDSTFCHAVVVPGGHLGQKHLCYCGDGYHDPACACESGYQLASISGNRWADCGAWIQCGDICCKLKTSQYPTGATNRTEACKCLPTCVEPVE